MTFTNGSYKQMIEKTEGPLDGLTKGVLVKLILPGVKCCAVLLLFFWY